MHEHEVELIATASFLAASVISAKLFSFLNEKLGEHYATELCSYLQTARDIRLAPPENPVEGRVAMRRAMLTVLLAMTVVESQAAGSLWSAKVIQVRVDSDGRGMVIFDQPIVGTPPGCVLPYYANALAFSGTGGKSVLALALVAKATGTPLAFVFGTGTCNAYGVAEDWYYGQ